jgi:hypothetical protein
MPVALLALATVMSAAMPAQAQEWHQAETAHFIVKSRDSEEATRHFAELMERYDRGLRYLMGLPEDHVEESAANKPVIYRFGDYADMSRLATGNAGAGIGGFFISRAGQSVGYAPSRRQRSNNSRDRRDRTDSIEQVLLHEYTHYFMMQNYPAAYPRWYSEGYAEMVSTIRFNEDGSFHIGDPPQSRGGIISSRPLSSLDEMLDDDYVATGYDQYQHYVTGWLLSHYLNFTPAREAKLREYLVAIGQGEDSLTAARRIFGDLDAIQRDLVNYRRGPFPGYDVRPREMGVPAVTVSEISGVEAELIDAEYTLWRGVSRDQANAFAARLRTAAQQHPDSAYVHMLLAEAEHDSKNYAAGLAAATRATELDARNQRAWLYRAYNAMELGETDPTQYAEARRALAQARQIDPDDPRPLIAFYESYYEEKDGVDLPEQAIAALEGAYDEAGSDVAFRLLLGRQLVMDNRLREARVVLMPGLYSGHAYEVDEEDEFTPQRLFDALDANDRDGALELLAKAFELFEGDEDEGGDEDGGEG